MVNDLEELKQDKPNIVIAEAVKDITFVQNKFKEQKMLKKKKYVMGLGVFQQLQYSSINNSKLLKPTRPLFFKAYKAYRGQPLDDKRLIVFRTGGIGDLLFIQPNLIFLKNKYPTCEILFACGPQYQPMVKEWDCVDVVLDLPFSFKYLIKSDYHALFEGVIERCKLAEKVNAFNLFSKWMGLDLPDNQLIPKQKPNVELVKECEKILDEWNIKKGEAVVMQLRASSPVRTPKHSWWKEVVDELNDRGYKVLLTDNPAQAESIDEFIKLLKNPSLTFNFCKYSKSIAYTIALTSLSKATIATDSALNHIAASLDIPCFGMYGPFPGKIRLKTYPKADYINAVKECAPCFIHGHDPCPQADSDGYSPCYNTINIREAINKFEALLERSND
jgi:ADP-heptose:LPS heptosyltransferase